MKSKRDLLNYTKPTQSSHITEPTTTYHYSENYTGGLVVPALGLSILLWWLAFSILTLRKMIISESIGTRNSSEAIRFEHGVYVSENRRTTMKDHGAFGHRRCKTTVNKMSELPTDF
jgi:hypothetical protein